MTRRTSANCQNAKKSTGPKSQLGKLRSSRNALRHGLAATFAVDPDGALWAMRVEAAASGTSSAGVSAQATMLGNAFAARRKIADVRFALLSSLARGDWAASDKLLSLERYELRAGSTMRRAMRALGSFLDQRKDKQ